jgi:ribonuclease P protein component
MKQPGLPGIKLLARQSEFVRVYRTGSRKSNKYLTIYACPVQGGGGKAGIVAGKRLGKAVERNRIRRRIKETIRISQHEIDADKDFVIVVKPPALNLPRRELAGQLLKLLRKSEVLDE